METARGWPGFAAPTRVRCPDPAPHRPAALASCYAGRSSDGNAINAGTWDAHTVAQLTAMRNLDLRDLNARLKAMDAALQQITPQINTLK
jgi:hypothetical protein